MILKIEEFVDMTVEIEVETIEYSELVAAFLPQLKDMSDDPVIKAISYVPPQLAGSVVKHIPQTALDTLVENIVNKKQDIIKQSLEELAEKNGFHIKLKNISVKK